jgi:hypothetical protein
MCGGGEGGIREVEKDYGRGIHSFILRDGGEGNSTRGGSLEDWRVKSTVEFTVHRGG